MVSNLKVVSKIKILIDGGFGWFTFMNLLATLFPKLPKTYREASLSLYVYLFVFSIISSFTQTRYSKSNADTMYRRF